MLFIIIEFSKIQNLLVVDISIIYLKRFNFIYTKDNIFGTSRATRHRSIDQSMGLVIDLCQGSPETLDLHTFARDFLGPVDIGSRRRMKGPEVLRASAQCDSASALRLPSGGGAASKGRGMLRRAWAILLRWRART